MKTILYGYSLFSILGLVLAGCKGTGNVTNIVSTAIAERSKSDVKEIDIGSLGDFSWDEMFIFGPYYPKGDVCKTLKVDARQCSTAGIEDVDEGEFLLVFMHEGSISKVEKFPRALGNFDESCLAKDIPRVKAQFKFERTPLPRLVCR